MCSRGSKPRYKANKSSDETKKVRNAPGSRLMECKATINVRLLKLDSGEFLLQVCLPMSSAHSNQSPSSLADLHSYKPLPEVVEKVEALVSHSHLNQISLLLALRDWIQNELIPKHMSDKILSERPSEYDRRYYTTVEDIRNISRKAINNIRKNMFDQDTLESFLEQESSKNKGFRYYPRKYSTYDKGTNDKDLNEKTEWYIYIIPIVLSACLCTYSCNNTFHSKTAQRSQTSSTTSTDQYKKIE